MTRGNGEKKRILQRNEQQEMPKFHIVKTLQTTRIISADDETYKLSETMKKECEGKTIFYNTDQEVINGADYIEDSIQIKNITQGRLLNGKLPQDRQTLIPCRNTRFKYSHDAEKSCGV